MQPNAPTSYPPTVIMSGLFNALKTRAQRFFEEDDANSLYKRKLSRDERFRQEFRLPEPESPSHQVNAQVAFLGPGESPQTFIDGRMYLSQSYLVFTAASDARILSFTIPLYAVHRVQRLPSKSHLFALRIVLFGDHTIVANLESMMSNCEQFSAMFTDNLKANSTLAKRVRKHLYFYSDYLVATINAQRQNKPGPSEAPPGGLGKEFGYPGDAKLLRDKPKVRLWTEYMAQNGRNVTLVRTPGFYRLIRVGLPNRLRGEVWELCSGSVHARIPNSGVYAGIIEEYSEQKSLALEEIEKDLNRSLPEYAAYLDDEGIGRLRRVLSAFSWFRPQIGYCQAMNIVTAALLIFQTEEQAFWTLVYLSDKLLPGYYSKTMYGTLLDQKVLEKLCEKTMPLLWEHFVRVNVPLSVVSLPWFLSLFINSMPLTYAFRVIDIFFLEGVRALFQISLAVLRVNGEALLKAEDNTGVIMILKGYFDTLDHSANPRAKTDRQRAVTKFQELMVVAFKEFSVVTNEMIHEHRARYEGEILTDIESFAKRTQLRNLKKAHNLSPAQIGVVYDRFYSALQTVRPGLGGLANELKPSQFIVFLSGVFDWAAPRSASAQTLEGHDWVKRLFKAWDRRSEGSLTLEDVVLGADSLQQQDMLELMNVFFALFEDPEQPGYVSQVVNMSEALLLMMHPYSQSAAKLDKISRSELAGGEQPPTPEQVERVRQAQMTRYLNTMGSFIKTALSQEDVPGCGVKFGALRMVILGDPTLELFFSHSWHESTHLDELGTGTGKPQVTLRSVIDNIMSDGMRVAGEVRRRIDELDREEDTSQLGVKESDHALLVDI